MTALQIRYFIAVAEYNSFSRAADALFVSQPSVSRQIHLLEQELGCALFDRTQTKHIVLTAAGHLYLDVFRRNNQLLEMARVAAQALEKQHRPRLRIGIGAGWDVSAQLCAFRDEVLTLDPTTQLHFECCTFRSQRQKLQRGELDAILCTETSVLDFDNLEMRPVARLECRAYVRKGLLHPEGQPLSIRDFSGQTLFMLSAEESPTAMERALMQFQSQQIMVLPDYVPDRESIFQAVLMGDGFTVIDSYTIWRNDPRVDYCPLDEQIPICVVWRKGENSPLIDLLCRHLSAGFLADPI